MEIRADLTPAPVGRRALAALLDAVPLLVTALLTAVAVSRDPRVEVALAFTGLSLLVLTLWWAYMTVASWRGGSVGKRLLGLRVVTSEGERLPLRTAFVREGLVKVIAPTAMVGLALPAALPVVPVFLALPALWHRRQRLCAHDVLAGTVVIDTRSGASDH